VIHEYSKYKGFSPGVVTGKVGVVVKGLGLRVCMVEIFLLLLMPKL
jgi:hypothetical protein